MQWILIALFILEMVRYLVALKCPSNCDCPSDVKAKCRSGSTFPNGLNSNLRILTVSEVPTTTLQEETIDKKNFSKLMILKLTYCQIQQVHANAFYGLPEMMFLDLSYNYIKYLNIDSFITNTNLKILILDSNPLDVKRKVFLRVPSLTKLSLVNCHISEIPSTYFNGLPNLKYLNLTDNYFKFLSVKTFKRLHSLEQLDLRRNKWMCDCALEPLILWYLRNIPSSEMEVSCAFPVGKVWNTDSTCLPSASTKVITSDRYVTINSSSSVFTVTNATTAYEKLSTEKTNVQPLATTDTSFSTSNTESELITRLTEFKESSPNVTYSITGDSSTIITSSSINSNERKSKSGIVIYQNLFTEEESFLEMGTVDISSSLTNREFVFAVTSTDHPKINYVNFSEEPESSSAYHSLSRTQIILISTISCSILLVSWVVSCAIIKYINYRRKQLVKITISPNQTNKEDERRYSRVPSNMSDGYLVPRRVNVDTESSDGYLKPRLSNVITEMSDGYSSDSHIYEEID